MSAACNEAEAVQLVVRPERDLTGVKAYAAVEGGDVDVEVRRVGYVLAEILGRDPEKGWNFVCELGCFMK